MPTYQLTGFGEIDPENLEDYYASQIDCKGRQVSLDMNFEEYSVKKENLEAVEAIISKLDLHDNKALAAIRQDYASGSATKIYIEQHTDITTTEKLEGSSVASDENNLTALLSKLYLKRIGFYPENENEFAVFDYTIGEEITQYLLVVNFKKDGEVDSLAVES